MSEQPKPPLLPIRRFAEQHGVSVRTVHRWAESEIIQKPERINGRNSLPANTEPRRDGDGEAA